MRRTAARPLIHPGCARRPASRVRHSAALLDWLTHAQSLTARIRASGARFEVRVLAAGHAPCRPWERRCARLAGPAYVRQVVLLADGVPVVWARSVLAQGSLHGPWRFLRGLGTRPLGGRLFTDPRVRREPFQYLGGATLRDLQRTAPAALPPALAARSAVLRRQRCPLLLTEVLLPGLLALESRPRQAR